MTSRIVADNIYSLLRKFSLVQARLMRMTVSVQNRFQDHRGGPVLNIPVCVSAGFEYAAWEPSWKTDVIKRLVTADAGVFVDVGANIGQTLLDLYSSHSATPYLGFEPNVSCVFYLKELIRENSFAQCQVIPAGLSDENGCMQLYRHKGNKDDTCATIIPDLRPGRLYDIDIVPCYRFDDIFPELNIGPVQFVKIDVEGAELETLIGMSKSLQAFRPVVLCEVLFADSKADLAAHKSRNDRLMHFLGKINYRVLQLLKSADDTGVVNVAKIENFASIFWTRENKDLCDYLFVPAEKETPVLRALLPATDPVLAS